SERCAIPPFIDSLLHSCLAKNPDHRPRTDELVNHFARLARGAAFDEDDLANTDARREVVAAPWFGRPRTIVAQLLDKPLPEAGGLGLTLAARVMRMVVEIASQLSHSDRELSALLDLEAKIREQLSEIERELSLH